MPITRRCAALLAGFALSVASPRAAEATYWNVFNIEGKSSGSAAIVTYDTRANMLADTGRTGVFVPNPLGFGPNIVDSGSDGTTYWNLFNIEGETSASAAIVTYSTLGDMLADIGRTGVFVPNPLGFGPNIVGSGSDGTTYWNVFNIEDKSSASAAIVTYDALADMLADTGRTGVFVPNPLGFGPNIVDAGSDGTTYWNVFNIEGESLVSAAIVTYSTLGDMLADTNRDGVFVPNPLGFGPNIVGSGSDVRRVTDPDPTATPEPASLGLLAGAMLLFGAARRR